MFSSKESIFYRKHSCWEGKANLDDMDDPTVIAELERANQALVDSVQTQTRALLGTVLDQRTVTMKNAFNMNDH